MHGRISKWKEITIICIFVIKAVSTGPSPRIPSQRPTQTIPRIRGGSDFEAKTAYSKYYFSVRTADDRASLLIETRTSHGPVSQETVERYKESVSRNKRLLYELEREESNLRIVLKAQEHIYQAIANTILKMIKDDE